MKLEEQIVLVTGASRGVGLAIARAFRAEGARVVLNYYESEPEDVEALAEEIGGAYPFQADVTDADEVKDLFVAAEEHFQSPITTVVNNAMTGGFEFGGDPGRLKIPDIHWLNFDVQLQGFLRGTLNTTQAALPGFDKLGGGRIVNIGSNLFHNPVVPYHDYTAAKGALLAFTRTCAAELGPKGVTVNMVSGGLLDTTDASASTPREVFEQIKAVTPLRKVTTPRDLAGAVLFFASPWADAITGQEMIVDGGLVMR